MEMSGYITTSFEKIFCDFLNQEWAFVHRDAFFSFSYADEYKTIDFNLKVK